MMKNCTLILLSFFLLSCNVIQSLTNGETKLEDEFFQRERTQLDLYPGLLDFWRFEEVAGANKISVNGTILTEMTTNNLIVVSGPRGNAISCTETSPATFSLENTGFSHPVAIGDILTFSFFLRQLTANSLGVVVSATLQTVFSIESGNFDGGLETTDLRLTFNGAAFMFSNVVPTGSFTHFTIVFSNQASPAEAEATLYVNGNFHGTITNGSGAANNITGINSCNPGGGGSSQIEIDSLGLWNRALSSEEIRSLANGYNNLD